MINNWFHSYLRNRYQFVQIDCIKSKILKISCEVPQKFIFGPLLLLLYINDIFNISKLAKVLMFADDTNLFFSYENLDDLISLVNCELNKFSNWFKLNKLSLNINKTNIMLFSSKDKKIYQLKYYNK
jgi:hypothetical protein